MCATKTLTVQLDATNQRGQPALGVKYTVYVNSDSVMTAEKVVPGYQSLTVECPEDSAVEVEASLPGWDPQRIRVDQATGRWPFCFPSAGIPAVLIVCALEKESRAMLDVCDSKSKLPHGTKPINDLNSYYVGEFRSSREGRPPCKVLVATSGMGTIGAAITATHALRSFPDEIRQILMVGIAGGCPNHKNAEEHVRLGDIVVSNERGVIQYDLIKRTIKGDKRRAIPHRPSAELMSAARSLEIERLDGQIPWEEILVNVAKAKKGYRRPSDDKDVLHAGRRVVSHPKDPDRRPRKPRVHRGAIGSANILLKDPALRDQIRDQYGARAIEMEGSGVMDAGWAVNKDIMVVRGICDYCDDYKSDDWQPYAALAAAAYAKCLVLALDGNAIT
jgi:nucleoside phosphorylase